MPIKNSLASAPELHVAAGKSRARNSQTMTEGSDIMLLQRQLAELQQELNHWSESRPVNGMGNYARQVKLESLQDRIASLRAAFSKSSGAVQYGNQNDKPIKPE